MVGGSTGIVKHPRRPGLRGQVGHGGSYQREGASFLRCQLHSALCFIGKEVARARSHWEEPHCDQYHPGNDWLALAALRWQSVPSQPQTALGVSPSIQGVSGLVVWSPWDGTPMAAVYLAVCKLYTHRVTDKGQHRRKTQHCSVRVGGGEGDTLKRVYKGLLCVVLQEELFRSEHILHVLPRHKAMRPSNLQEGNSMVFFSRYIEPLTLDWKNLPLTSGKKQENCQPDSPVLEERDLTEGWWDG